jgi:hypothetical protein
LHWQATAVDDVVLFKNSIVLRLLEISRTARS